MSAAAAQLPGVFGTLAPLLDQYGYLALAGFTFFEDFGVPLPGETILIAAAIYAGTGHLNIFVVLALSIAAAVLGDNVGYAIGHVGGRRLALRWGRFVLITPERFDKAEHWFSRHGGKVVTVARFIEGLRQVNGIVAGVSGMRWRRFLAFNTLGAALWVGLWSGVGYFSGNHITAVYDLLSRIVLYVIGAAVVLVAVRLSVHLRRRHRRSAAEVAPPATGASVRAEDAEGAAVVRSVHRAPSRGDDPACDDAAA